MSDLPRNGEAVTPDWLARVMKPVHGPVAIDTVAAAPLEDAPSYNGTFSLAVLAAAGGPADMPVSVVVKMVPANPAIRALGRPLRPAERRVGKECVSRCYSRWSPIQ